MRLVQPVIKYVVIGLIVTFLGKGYCMYLCVAFPFDMELSTLLSEANTERVNENMREVETPNKATQGRH